MSAWAIVFEIVLPTGVYLGMALFTLGRVAAAVAWARVARYPALYSTPEWGYGLVLGFVNAVVWPLTLPLWVCSWYANSRGPNSSALFAPPPHLRGTVAKLEREQYERRIRTLEREAGIR